MRLNKTIIQPVITEKSVSLGEKNKYVFKVDMKATKHAVAEQLQNMFDVKVVEVSTMVVPGKKKRILGTRRFTKTPKWKKAVVKLEEGQSIDLFPSE